MNTARILHQQAMQLKWYVLASLALIMVLPLEEAFVNLRGGYGFYSSNLTTPALVLGPFLAGLIACANVQADLDDRRLIFWRSKPIKVRTFITLKFVTGLLLSAIVVCLPMVFSIISLGIVGPRGSQPEPDRLFFWSWLLISVLAYGLCFLSNVLVRKTARAWLIGITVTAFLLLVPFILPIEIRSPYACFLYAASPVFTTALLTTAASAFLLSLLAVAHNWHLRTNLKGLLWAAAGLAFALSLAFSHQIANIPILDQAAAPETFTGFLSAVDGRIVAPGIAEVHISDGQIQLQPMPPSSEPPMIQIDPPAVAEPGLRYREDIWLNRLFCEIEQTVYAYSVDRYYREIKIEDETHVEYEKLKLRISKFQDGRLVPVSLLDFSDYIADKEYPRVFLRRVDEKLIIGINRSILVGQIQQDGRLEIMERRAETLPRPLPRANIALPQATFSVPLVQVDQLSMEERIRLSIDYNFNLWWGDFSKSLVDTGAEGIIFCLVGDRQIEKYKVIRWDEKAITCRFVERRLFTALETIFESFNGYDWRFVKDGKLYVWVNQKLLVFDIRNGIEKLGHFERIADNCYISDVEVLESGKILVSLNEMMVKSKGQWQDNHHLYLLDNPE